jgi:hypothetical protein
MSLRKCTLHVFHSAAVLESPLNFIEITEHEWGRDVKLHDKSQTTFITPATTNTVAFEHIFGIYNLPSGPYAALLLDSESFVAMKTPLINIRLAKNIIIVPLILKRNPLSAIKEREEKITLDLLHQAFATHKFFYSPSGYDLTLTQQVSQKYESSKIDSSLSSWKKSDRRFFWNHNVMSDFITIEAHNWIVPFMSAYIEFVPDCNVDDEKFSILFISRRSCHRQGCRFTRRGIDNLGNCANFCETEQTLLFPSGKITSYVQIRGSIPVIWKSPSSLKYDPIVSIDNDITNCNSYCEDHFQSLNDIYAVGRGAMILCVNLIDKKKDQEKLGMAYMKTIENIKSRLPCLIRYEWFDFHAETKKKGKWNNLSKLLMQVDADFTSIGYFSLSPNGEVLHRQNGVIRTNCMDNLDRTNVTQSLFARRSLLSQLDKLSGTANSNVMDSPYKKFEKSYKVIWANNADAISNMYAGTGALKVDFTKTGKRTLKGMYNDVVNSMLRYYTNNFCDGSKQDCIDLVLGKYSPVAVYDFEMKSEALSTSLYKLCTLLALTFLCVDMLPRVIPILKVDAASMLLRAIGFVAFFAVIGFLIIFKYGSKIGERMVGRPKIVIEY